MPVLATTSRHKKPYRQPITCSARRRPAPDGKLVALGDGYPAQLQRRNQQAGDEQGEKTRLGRMPMAPKPLYEPEVVARAIVHAAQRPQREIPIEGSAALFILGQRFAPAVMDFVLSRDFMMFAQQQTELANRGVDNLDRSSSGVGQTHSQRLESSTKVSSVKQRSYFTEVVWQQPLVKRGLLAGGVAALVWRLLR
jgi:hypothetical protein